MHLTAHASSFDAQDRQRGCSDVSRLDKTDISNKEQTFQTRLHFWEREGRAVAVAENQAWEKVPLCSVLVDDKRGCCDGFVVVGQQ